MVYPDTYNEIPQEYRLYFIRRVIGDFGFVLLVVALKVGPCDDYQLKQNIKQRISFFDASK